MKRVRAIPMIVLLMLFGVTAWAQEFPRFELGVDYSFARFSPNAQYTQGHSLNGGGGSFVININEYLGLKADFQGYQSTTNGFTFPKLPSFPNGAQGNASGDLFTYMFGPQLKVRAHRIHPFAHVLFGAAHANVYSNAYKAICNPAVGTGTCNFKQSPADDAFAMAFGGGIDIPVGHIVELRPAEIDYLLTRFTNPFANSNQNNFRYSAGLVFNLKHSSY